MSATDQTILVTGASGHLGALVVEQLIERGHPAQQIIAGARSVDKIAHLGQRQVRLAELDYERPDTVRDALVGVDVVVLISSSEVGRRAAQHRNVIDAVKESDVTRLVYTSLTHANASQNPLAPEHRETEEALQASGVPFVIVRNNWYTENYVADVAQARDTGELVASAGEGQVASASRRDYAEGVAVVALGDGHEGKIYEFGGDIAWNYDELAASISQVVGRDVTYRAIDSAEHRELLESAGLDHGTASFVAALDAGIARGDLEFTDGTLSRLIGRPTTPLVEGLRQAL